MINNVVLVGRLTKDPDLRFTGNGSAVATFTIAVNRNFTNQAGDREADFINCVIWRKPAETLANFTRKGSLIGVVGRIQTRNYENQQGNRVYVTEVVCDNFQMLEKKPENETNGNQGYTNLENDVKEDTVRKENSGHQQEVQGSMFDTKRPHSNTFEQDSQIDISDDDLPF